MVLHCAIDCHRKTFMTAGARFIRPHGHVWLLMLCVFAGFGALTGRALAVPAFAVQTGQPCQTCHVGGFGPQLTPYGRNFKIHGYTQRSNAFNVPLAVMAEASYVNTVKAQTPPTPGFAPNNNFAVDQISLFLAGGLGSHLGAFIQTTYDGVARAFSWDNLDVRALTNAHVGKGVDMVIGASLNNSPTVQDAWNTLPAWGFPYTSSALEPSPAISPLISGALAQTSLGLTGYTWINSTLYLEAGAYGSPGATTLTHLGADPTSPGSIRGLAPYGRLAVQHEVAGGTLEGGVFGMGAAIYPALDRSLGLTDDYADIGVDASYYRALQSGDVVTLNARYIHERQDLHYTCAIAAQSGAACAPHSDLNDVRIDASYYWRNKVGFTIQGFDTAGSSNAFVYQVMNGFRVARPDSAGVMFQIDGTPFGGAPLLKRANFRVGLQYTLYTQFNGAGSNYDGAGSRASGNNALRVFTWLAF
jgi:hypothetical protein